MDIKRMYDNLVVMYGGVQSLVEDAITQTMNRGVLEPTAPRNFNADRLMAIRYLYKRVYLPAMSKKYKCKTKRE